MKSKEIKTECPCCGKTKVGEYGICDNCNWENDPIQADHPEYDGGANHISLNEARKAYLAGS